MIESAYAERPAPALDHRTELARLERLANTMDAAFRLPVIGVRIGWDSLIGLIPGIGDAAALTPAAWIVWRARQLGAPNALLLRMGVHIAADTVIGAIPLVGDLLDIGIKANRRNVALLRAHLEAEGKVQPKAAAAQKWGDRIFDKPTVRDCITNSTS